MVGLGAMVGAGLFTGLAPASAFAGRWLLLGVVLAAATAAFGCRSTCGQSGAHPGSGGGYRDPRERLGRWPGRMAGGLYLTAGAGSAGAVASTFGAYVAPASPRLAALAVLVLAVVADACGVRFSRGVSRVVVGFVLVVLAIVVVTCLAVAPPPPTGVAPPAGVPGSDDLGGLLPASGVLFFAFLGFERVTAPGTGQAGAAHARLRLVIPLLVAAACAVYLVVGFAVLRQLGPERLAISAAPLRDALAAADGAALAPLVTLAALVATGYVLLAVVGGGRRAAEEMAAGADLPGGGRDPLRGPVGRAVVVVGGAVGVLVANPAQLVTLAATCGLIYHAFTNAAARLSNREDRTWPVRAAWLGAGLCVLVGMTMPAVDLAVALGAAVAGAVLGPLVSTPRSVPRDGGPDR